MLELIALLAVFLAPDYRLAPWAVGHMSRSTGRQQIPRSLRNHRTTDRERPTRRIPTGLTGRQSPAQG